jgi:hypothetical protein
MPQEALIRRLLKEIKMSIDRIVLGFAGSMVLVSLLLSVIHSPYWLWFTAFVGANLLQSSITGFCPLAIILKTIGIKPGKAFE